MGRERWQSGEEKKTTYRPDPMAQLTHPPKPNNTDGEIETIDSSFDPPDEIEQLVRKLF